MQMHIEMRQPTQPASLAAICGMLKEKLEGRATSKRCSQANAKNELAYVVGSLN